MLDPSKMYPKSFHPMVIGRTRDFRGKAKGHTRTRCRPRYFLIDLGLSRKYDPANGPPLEVPLRGGDKSAPEHQDRETHCNTFPTDICKLCPGGLYPGPYLYLFLNEGWMARNNEIWPVTAWRTVSHWYRPIGYVITRKPALPEPN